MIQSSGKGPTSENSNWLGRRLSPHWGDNWTLNSDGGVQRVSGISFDQKDQLNIMQGSMESRGSCQGTKSIRVVSPN